jgi:hypothetical protein
MLEEPRDVSIGVDEGDLMRQLHATLSRMSGDAHVECVSSLIGQLQQVRQEMTQPLSQRRLEGAEQTANSVLTRNSTSEREPPRVTVSVVGEGASTAEEAVVPSLSPGCRGVKRPSSPTAGPSGGLVLEAPRYDKRVRPVGGDD